MLIVKLLCSVSWFGRISTHKLRGNFDNMLTHRIESENISN